MCLNTTSWEQNLLEWAYQGSQSAPVDECTTDRAVLRKAYAFCAALTKTHSHTFFLASGLLSGAKRQAARALYAFCRISDDLVDRATGDANLALERWRQRTAQDCSDPYDAVLLAWNHAQVVYNIPRLYAQQLMDGVARDLAPARYATFADLAQYCYGVASTVGLMAMHIIGFDGPAAIPYAVKLGVALQLTNILRDVGEDWRAGRLYLPLEELFEFGLTEEDLAAGIVDERWRALMRFQIERVRRLYAESLPGLAYLHPDGRYAINAAAQLYCAILDDLEAHGMDNLHRRSYVGLWEKMRRLPGIWWEAKTAKPPEKKNR
ncbi:MAG: squalene/phytoene synthase family protein [Anaerolineae bacterium]|nr:squalene/phytoene synthase family protein [Anaerolineae bacterium]